MTQRPKTNKKDLDANQVRTEAAQEAIRDHYADIHHSLPGQDLVTKMFSEKLLTDYEKQCIDAERTPYQRNDLILEALRRRSGPQIAKFLKLWKSLQVNDDLVNLVIKNYESRLERGLKDVNQDPPVLNQRQYSSPLSSSLGPHPNAKNQPINTSHQPESATAPKPPDCGKPSVGVMSDVGDEESKTKDFRSMNVTISSSLTKSNLQNLKYLFQAEGIPESNLEGDTSGVDLFQLLEQKGVYTPHKVSVVKKALKTLGREDLIEHILTFESVWRYEEHKPKPINTSHQPESATEPKPPEQRPGVGNEQDAQLKNVKFAIITANRNERESAKYVMGAQMINCDLSLYLQDVLPEKFKDGVAFQTDGISVEFAETEPLFKSRTVANTNFRYTYTYFYVKVCGVLGVLTECYRMGSQFPGASKDTVNVLLETAKQEHWDLDAVFLVGCCGCARGPEVNVELGTVLIADPIIPYAGRLTDEGLKMPSKNKYEIIKRWVSLLIEQNGEEKVSKDSKLKVQNLQGAHILSSDTLIANARVAEELRASMCISVLGFEMEGAGAHEIISRWNTDPKLSDRTRPAILVVKGVSDFANSDKNEPACTTFFETMTKEVDKDSRQQMCTVMSLMVVFRAIKAEWGLKEKENPAVPS